MENRSHQCVQRASGSTRLQALQPLVQVLSPQPAQSIRVQKALGAMHIRTPHWIQRVMHHRPGMHFFLNHCRLQQMPLIASVPRVALWTRPATHRAPLRWWRYPHPRSWCREHSRSVQQRFHLQIQGHHHHHHLRRIHCVLRGAVRRTALGAVTSPCGLREAAHLLAVLMNLSQIRVCGIRRRLLFNHYNAKRMQRFGRLSIRIFRVITVHSVKRCKVLHTMLALAAWRVMCQLRGNALLQTCQRRWLLQISIGMRYSTALPLSRKRPFMASHVGVERHRSN